MSQQHQQSTPATMSRDAAIAHAIGVLAMAFGKHIAERFTGKAAAKMLGKALEEFTPQAIAAGAEKIAMERPTLYPGDNLLAILRESIKAQAVALIGPEREDWERRQRVLEGYWLNAKPREAVPDLRYAPGSDLEGRFATYCKAHDVEPPDFAEVYRPRGLAVPRKPHALALVADPTSPSS